MARGTKTVADAIALFEGLEERFDKSEVDRQAEKEKTREALHAQERQLLEFKGEVRQSFEKLNGSLQILVERNPRKEPPTTLEWIQTLTPYILVVGGLVVFWILVQAGVLPSAAGKSVGISP